MLSLLPEKNVSEALRLQPGSQRQPKAPRAERSPLPCRRLACTGTQRTSGWGIGSEVRL